MCIYLSIYQTKTLQSMTGVCVSKRLKKMKPPLLPLELTKCMHHIALTIRNIHPLWHCLTEVLKRYEILCVNFFKLLFLINCPDRQIHNLSRHTTFGYTCKSLLLKKNIIFFFYSSNFADTIVSLSTHDVHWPVRLNGCRCQLSPGHVCALAWLRHLRISLLHRQGI